MILSPTHTVGFGEKGIEIAKQLVLGKLEGQNVLLNKYGFQTHDMNQIKHWVNRLQSKKLKSLRPKLMQIEGTATKKYFGQLFGLIPEKIRPSRRKSWKAYDGVNNLFNLGYEVLSWKVHRACLKAKLEPFLGFLHSVQYSKPSLVCDLEELYRYLVDDFVFDYVQGLKPGDFTTKTVEASKSRKGKSIRAAQKRLANGHKNKDLIFSGIRPQHPGRLVFIEHLLQIDSHSLFTIRID